jgi:hypothetical protein
MQNQEIQDPTPTYKVGDEIEYTCDMWGKLRGKVVASRMQKPWQRAIAARYSDTYDGHVYDIEGTYVGGRHKYCPIKIDSLTNDMMGAAQ